WARMVVTRKRAMAVARRNGGRESRNMTAPLGGGRVSHTRDANKPSIRKRLWKSSFGCLRWLPPSPYVRRSNRIKIGRVQTRRLGQPLAAGALRCRFVACARRHLGDEAEKTLEPRPRLRLEIGHLGDGARGRGEIESRIGERAEALALQVV